MHIIFGTPEAVIIRAADKQLLARQEQQDELIRNAERRDLQFALRELRDELRIAYQLEQPTERLKELIAYVKTELNQYPSYDEEHARLQRWNEWATGNPAAVEVYQPEEEPCPNQHRN